MKDKYIEIEKIVIEKDEITWWNVFACFFPILTLVFAFVLIFINKHIPNYVYFAIGFEIGLLLCFIVRHFENRVIKYRLKK